MNYRVLICYVPKPQSDDGLAKKGADYFGGQLNSIGGRGILEPPKLTTALLAEAIPASKVAAEFLSDSTSLVVIGHGSAVYGKIDLSFYDFLGRFKQLQSLIFISCELDKQHVDLPGFEANVINLLVKSLGSRFKVYASKTDVQFTVLKAQNFVWMHTPLTHLVPVTNTGVVRKNPQTTDVQDSMDIFSSN